MNINSNVAGLTDELSDYVGLKSGLIVTAADVVRLLDRDRASSDVADWYCTPPEWLHDEPQQWVRIRAEDLESLVIRLLYAVGALPSPWNQIQLAYKFALEHPEIAEAIPPEPDEDEYPFPVFPVQRLIWLLSAHSHPKDLPTELVNLKADFKKRSIVDLMFNTERLPWDGCVPLKDLFEVGRLGGTVEANSESPPLIDQRFIDYLHAQPDDLSEMHWRQFEFLVGEFFRRTGYDISVTPPSNDGGIDVRAIREDGAVGPELILIQAKRLGDNRRVGIEVVKALWSDVDEAAATRGVVATTSTLAPGARAFCQARHYRLTSAERPTVEKWLKGLATYPR